MPHCPVSIKIFFWQETTRNKLPHWSISMLGSPCFMLMPPCSCSHAPVYMLLLSHVKNWHSHRPEIFFDKRWPMSNCDGRCCCELKSCDKIFLGNSDRLRVMAKRHQKNWHSVPSLCSCSLVDKRQKEKKCLTVLSPSKKILTKDNQKQIASLCHLHQKFLLTKHNQK